MKVILKPTGRLYQINGVETVEAVDIIIGALKMGRILGNKVSQANRVVYGSPLEGIQEVTGCSEADAKDALERYAGPSENEMIAELLKEQSANFQLAAKIHKQIIGEAPDENHGTFELLQLIFEHNKAEISRAAGGGQN